VGKRTLQEKTAVSRRAFRTSSRLAIAESVLCTPAASHTKLDLGAVGWTETTESTAGIVMVSRLLKIASGGLSVSQTWRRLEGYYFGACWHPLLRL
jgi:hypothetical protein